MSETDILEVLNLIKSGIKTRDWDSIIEAKIYLEEYIEQDSFDEEEDY